MLKTLRRGIANAAREEEGHSGITTFQSVGCMTRACVQLGIYGLISDSWCWGNGRRRSRPSTATRWARRPEPGAQETGVWCAQGRRRTSSPSSRSACIGTPPTLPHRLLLLRLQHWNSVLR